MRSRNRDTDKPTEAELAALADGSLSDERRAALEKRVAGSPELMEALDRQRIVVSAIREATGPAPARVRTKVAAERARVQREPAKGWRPWIVATGATAAAGVIVALALSLSGGGPGAPTLDQAAALTVEDPTQPAPKPVPAVPSLLAIQESGLPYPNWSRKLGWKPVGSRRDDINERGTTTVYYDKAGKRVGYTIVSGKALSVPSDAKRFTRDGIDMASYIEEGRMVVTWERDGHTCVISGVGVPQPVLVKLVTWKPPPKTR